MRARVSLLSTFHIFVIIAVVECDRVVTKPLSTRTTTESSQNKAPHKIKKPRKVRALENENAFAAPEIDIECRSRFRLFATGSRVCSERARRPVKYEILGSSKSQRRGDRNQPRRNERRKIRRKVQRKFALMTFERAKLMLCLRITDSRIHGRNCPSCSAALVFRRAIRPKH